MKLRILSLLVLLVLVPAVFGQNFDEQKKCVAFIFANVQPTGPGGQALLGLNGQPVTITAPLGTGFFVNYPDKRGGEDFGFSYFVTAKHVLKQPDGRYLPAITISLNLKQPANGTFRTSLNVPVLDQAGNLLWFTDPTSEAVDVAIFPLLPSVDVLDFKEIPTGMFLSEEMAKREGFSEGDSVYFMGLMPQYFGEKKNYPVLRRGSVALLTDEEIETPTGRQKTFVVELNAWPGNSGSPVFVSFSGFRRGAMKLGGGTPLIGLLQGHYNNVIPAQVVPSTNIYSGDQANTGIAFVIPASAILSVLESPRAVEQRLAELRRLGKIK